MHADICLSGVRSWWQTAKQGIWNVMGFFCFNDLYRGLITEPSSRSNRPFFSTSPSRFPHLCLHESAGGTVESVDGICSRTPTRDPRDSKKAGYSELLFIAKTHTERSELSSLELHSHKEAIPLFCRGKLQHGGPQPGSCEYPHQALPPS